MRIVLLAIVLAFGFGCLTGCDSSDKSKPAPGNDAPPPEDSGADKKATKRPGPPPKQP